MGSSTKKQTCKETLSELQSSLEDLRRQWRKYTPEQIDGLLENMLSFINTCED